MRINNKDIVPIPTMPDTWEELREMLEIAHTKVMNAQSISSVEFAERVEEIIAKRRNRQMAANE